MRESIGSIALYNIIIVFIVVTFSVLAGTMSYSKAFKVNNRIINAIEKYEGYNENSKNQIEWQLSSLGYQVVDGNVRCSNRNGVPAYNKGDYQNYEYCIYKNNVKTTEWDGRYVQYGIVSYIYVNFPVLGDFLKIPVYGTSRKIFEFNPEYAPDPIIQYSFSVVESSNWQDMRYLNNNKLVFDNSLTEGAIRDNLIVSIFLNSENRGQSLDYHIDVHDTGKVNGNYHECAINITMDNIAGKETVSYWVLNPNKCW